MALKLTIKQGSENYCCTVVEIDNLHVIDGADFIQRTILYGNNIVISKDIKEGDIMLYIPAMCRLNLDFCKYNNLFSDSTLNNNTDIKGHISKTGRTKAIKLKGIISDGILLPLLSLAPVLGLSINLDELNVGDTFTDINDVSICEKYVVPVARNSNPGGKAPKINKVKDLLIENQFRLHSDTAHFARNLHKFEDNDNIIITRKFHGTSGISSHVLIKRNLNFIERFLLWFNINIPKTEYGYIYSSGKPKSGKPKGIYSSNHLLKYDNTEQSFYKENYWLKAFGKLKPFLEKGITLYYEIVGEGIQGDDYTYGFEHEIFVYRITQTNVDGIVYEFSWEQVKNYCNKYNINYVSEYNKCTYLDLKKEAECNSEDVIQTLTGLYLNKSYGDCKVDEGICIRNERTNEIFKLKSSAFILKESSDAENEISNLEDNQDE
jgi:hypothetical protein